jgi:hypothetical protein
MYEYYIVMDRHKLKTVSAFIGVVAFSVTVAAHMLNVAYAKKLDVSLICGIVLLITGYTLLLVGSTFPLRDKDKDTNIPHNDNTDDETYVTRFGYAFLAIFFGLIHIYPQLTFHVRYYDKFAAIGAFLLAISKLQYLTVIGVLILLVYYVLGTIPKFTETGLVNKLQLFSRAILIVYYSIILALLV